MICGIMVSVLAMRAVDSGFEPLPGQTKDYKIGICCFSSKHAVLRKNNLLNNTVNSNNYEDPKKIIIESNPPVPYPQK
jgi:hypothetical protein